MKRPPKESIENFTSKSDTTSKKVKTKGQYKQSNSGEAAITKQQSTTATIEIGSTTCAVLEPNSNKTENEQNEETREIHLASGEEDISDDESDILLNHTTVIKDFQANQSANGTTFL